MRANQVSRLCYRLHINPPLIIDRRVLNADYASSKWDKGTHYKLGLSDAVYVANATKATHVRHAKKAT
jgi:hypothetical protein